MCSIASAERQSVVIVVRKYVLILFIALNDLSAVAVEAGIVRTDACSLTGTKYSAKNLSSE